ncbi:MAG: FAD:protein FMN transferase [Lachnospiraceae bacterium]|nr:FAD:protein FMN transferase [Ruminococcus sp.]MCM1274400.1 FAD:protein FMN transferase [Lachnospiraceae bacterium]
MKLKIFLSIALCLLLAACSGAPEEYSHDFFAMDTFMSVSAYGGAAEEGVKSAARRITELEKKLSVTDESSELSALNRGGAVAVSPETAELVSFALEIAEKTGGALDPTIYPVLRAWGFTTDENRVPSPEELSALLKNVGYERVTVDGSTITLAEGMMLDMGAVAKGYASDETARILRENGVTSALINLGGNIRLVGSRPDGSGWRLGIKDSSGSGNVGVLTVSDRAVVTSGSYERCFTADGKTYGHIIDPASGFPADNGLLSATVISEEGRLCDALSTALFVMGAERSVEFWRENKGFDFILITDNGEVLITNGIADKFALDGAHTDLSVRVVE